MNNLLLSLLSKKELQGINIKEFSKNEIIFHENDKCLSIGVVLNGQLDIVSYSYNGDELVYNSLKKDMIFGNNLLFSSSPFYKGNVVAKENTVVAFIAKNQLIKILRENEKFLEVYLQIQSDFGKHLNNQIKLLSYASAEERFLYYLYSNNNVITYISITDLSNKVHLKRETLSRLITLLEKRHLIRRLNKQIILID